LNIIDDLKIYVASDEESILYNIIYALGLETSLPIDIPMRRQERLVSRHFWEATAQYGLICCPAENWKKHEKANFLRIIEVYYIILLLYYYYYYVYSFI